MDWMVTERGEDLKALMHDNATFIQFPPIGSSTSLITVIGDNRVNVQRTIRSIMQLVCLSTCTLPCASDLLNSFVIQACQFYVASLWLLPAQFNVLMPSTSLNPSQVSAILKQVSYASGAEIVFKGMCFEMHGLEHEVRAAVSMLLDLDIVKVCFTLTLFLSPCLISPPT